MNPDNNQFYFDLDMCVKEHADAIRILAKQTAEGILEIGKRLVEVRELLPHGDWLPWLEKELGWTRQTACNFINAYEKFKCQNFGHLQIDVSALYRLSAPNLPEPIFNEAVAKAKDGERVTHQYVDNLKKQHTDVTENAPPNIVEAMDGGEVNVSEAAYVVQHIPQENQPSLTVSDIRKAAKEAALDGVKLPTPSEAREISRRTGEMVVGSDGKYHVYTTPEQDKECHEWRNFIRSLETLAVIDLPPEKMCEIVPSWQQENITEKLPVVYQWLSQFNQYWSKNYE